VVVVLRYIFLLNCFLLDKQFVNSGELESSDKGGRAATHFESDLLEVAGGVR